ncbi:TetR/AcrR family transcriptional regulator [Massilia orientalis]|uniref:TetR/AcrR family transcriptional regulator n=1 Tax=Massilia orientalis TaxID=3050128 RepID=A0ACC7MNK7_9BURK|nr:TetR/AcrR family transcriptional regulator [Massilia sp. YIM B02787]
MPKTLPSSDNTEQPVQERADGERPKLRGRPRKEHAGNIDAEILKAAIALFDEMGFDGTAMEAVAARAGISKRTLYMRYPDKKALIKAVITSIVGNARNPDPPAFVDMRSCLMFHVENFFMICNDPGMRVLMAMGDKPSPTVRELTSLGQEITYELGIRHIVQTIVDTAGRVGMTVHEPAFYAASLLDLAMAHYQRYRALGATVGIATTRVASIRIVNLLFAGMQADCAAPN